MPESTSSIQASEGSGSDSPSDQLQFLINAGDQHAVESLLLSYPELQNDRDALLELIYLEYVLRRETNHLIDEASLCDRFPHLAQDIRMLMEVDAAVQWSPISPVDGTCAILDQSFQLSELATSARHQSRAPYSALLSSPLTDMELPDFKIIEKIGQGGMGLVYRAHQHSLNRTVAIKTINVAASFHPAMRARFHTEAELSAKLQHRNIVQIYSVGECDGIPYFTMELVRGPNLADAIAQHAMPFQVAAKMVATLARAIHYAHNKGIIHRDLKPTNVLLAPSEGQEVLKDWSDHEPKIADFGLARFSQATGQQTRTGSVLGTPSYMSPEQIMDQDRVGPASDIYSLGAILYTLLAGQPPFHTASPLETLRQVRQEDPVPLRHINSRLPPDLETICLKCLQKEPSARYASAEHLAVDLEQFLLNKPIAARPTSTIERTWKWTRRHPSLSALLVALCCCSVVTTSLWWQAKSSQFAEQKQRERAERLNADRELQHAQREYEAFNVDGCKQLLDACPPEHRHWEWHYLSGLCNQALWESPRNPQSAMTTDISRDGSLVAIGFGRWGYDAPQEIHVWDIGKQKLQWKLSGHPNCSVADVSFSPDGKYLLSAGVAWNSNEDAEYGGVFLWDLATGEPRWKLPEVNALVARYHRDGQSLFVGTTQGSVTQHAALDGRLMQTYRARDRKQLNSLILDMAFDFDAGRLAASSRSGELAIWKLGESEPAYFLNGLGDPRQVEFLPDGQQVFVGGYAGTRQWYALQPDGIHSMHRDSVEALPYIAFSPDGLNQVSSIYGRGVELTETTSGKLIRCLHGHLGHVRDMAFDGSGMRLVTCGQDGRAMLWDLSKEERRPKQVTVAGKVAAIEGSVKANEVALVMQENPARGARTMGKPRVELRDPRDLKLLHTLKLSCPATCISYSQDGSCILVGLTDNVVQVWSSTGQAATCSYSEHKDRIIDVAFDPRTGEALSIDSRGVFACCNSRDGRLSHRQTLPEGITLADFHPTRPWLAVADESFQVSLWNYETWKLLAKLPAVESIQYLNFSPDGRLLGVALEEVALGARRSAIHLHDSDALAKGDVNEPRSRISGHLGAVTGFSFSPDQERLVTISDDETVRLFDIELGCEVHLLDTEKGNDGTVFFSRDGKCILRARSNELASWKIEPPQHDWLRETASVRLERLKAWHRTLKAKAVRMQEWKAARYHATALIEQGEMTQLYQRGLYNLFDKQWVAAEKDLRASIDSNDTIAARCQLARLALKLGRVDEYLAISAHLCTQIHEKSTAEDINRICWTVCLLAENDAIPYSSLLKHLNQAIEKQENSMFHNTLALIHYRLGDFAKAQISAEKSMKLDASASAPFDWLILELCAAQQANEPNENPAGQSKRYLGRITSWLEREEEKLAVKTPVNISYAQTHDFEITWFLEELKELQGDRAATR